MSIDYNSTKNMTYDDYLDEFRKYPAADLEKLSDEFRQNLPAEGYAAYMRWREILENPSKIDKLYSARLKANSEADIMEIAVGDDDEKFWKALIQENVRQLNSSTVSPQEAARLTTNIGIFRDKLKEVMSRKPKKGTVLEQVLQKAAIPPKTKKPAKKQASKTASKAPVKKKTTTVSSKETDDTKPKPKN